MFQAAEAAAGMAEVGCSPAHWSQLGTHRLQPSAPMVPCATLPRFGLPPSHPSSQRERARYSVRFKNKDANKKPAVKKYVKVFKLPVLARSLLMKHSVFRETGIAGTTFR